jgi:hypothetical protein
MVSCPLTTCKPTDGFSQSLGMIVQSTATLHCTSLFPAINMNMWTVQTVVPLKVGSWICNLKSVHLLLCNLLQNVKQQGTLTESIFGLQFLCDN